MSFVSPEFALLCLIFFPVYWSLANFPRVQRGLLIASAYGLYASWAPVFALVLVAYSSVIWALGQWMRRLSCDRLPLILGLWLVGIFLFTIKYHEFVRETFQVLLQHTGFVSLMPVLEWVAPVGVSFFTFQAVTYLVMVGRAPASARSWPDVVLFLSFWPTLFAGPIMRAEHFFAQQDAKVVRRVGRPRKAWVALYWIALGLVQKVVLASWLSSQVVDPVYKLPEQYASVSLAGAMLAYSLQIFLDFAGYTLIVSGLALWLGYRLPVNFHQPYLARNLSDFWTRWHVSLSSFIRDYIYIPMGGNRGGWWRTQRNVLTGMLISGLWHGAQWTFVVWGLLHGLGVVAQNTTQRLGMPVWPRWAAQVLTFVFVSLAWVFFRAESVPQAWQMLQGLWSSSNGFWQSGQLPWWGLLGTVVLVFGLSPHALRLERSVVTRLACWGPWWSGVGLALLVSAVLYFAPEGVPGFIYYQF
jgi:alginate O-acetyltransferase complex protein AlgI